MIPPTTIARHGATATIVRDPDLGPLPANTPAFYPGLVALGKQSIALCAEHLDLPVLHPERILHLAEGLLERPVPLRELHHLTLEVRPGGAAQVAVRQHAVGCERVGEVCGGEGGSAGRRGRGAVSVAFTALGGGQLQSESAALAG